MTAGSVLSQLHVAIATDDDPESILELGRYIEELGFGGIWVPEFMGRDAFLILAALSRW